MFAVAAPDCFLCACRRRRRRRCPGARERDREIATLQPIRNDRVLPKKGAANLGICVFAYALVLCMVGVFHREHA